MNKKQEDEITSKCTAFASLQAPAREIAAPRVKRQVRIKFDLGSKRAARYPHSSSWYQQLIIPALCPTF